MALDRARHARRRLLQGSLALAGGGLLAGCGLPPWVERTARISRIGYLPGGTGQEGAEAFRQALEEHGYVVGRAATLEWRDIEGRVERYPDFAAELVRLPVDVLVAMARQRSGPRCMPPAPSRS